MMPDRTAGRRSRDSVPAANLMARRSAHGSALRSPRRLIAIRRIGRNGQAHEYASQ